jgi:hypothetical protein
MAYLPNLIRKGAEITDPGTGHYFKAMFNSACAIGAAAVALQGKHASRQNASECILGIDGREIPDVKEAPFPSSLSDSIIHLNDEVGMSREAVAEWLEEKVPDEKLQVRPANAAGPIALTSGEDPGEDPDTKEGERRELQSA